MPRSLQWRLSLGLGLGIGLLWVSAIGVTAQNLFHEMNEVFDSALEETAQRILPLAVIDVINREEEGITQRVEAVRPHDEYLTYLVRDAKGNVLLRSHEADENMFPSFSGVGFVDTPTHRIYFDAALQGSVNIAVAEPTAHRREAATEVLVGLALPLALVLPLSLLGIWLLVRTSMAPVQAFGKEIELRSGADLAPVSAIGLPAEIEPIAEALNRLLDRLRRALEAERGFTANSAHELRTPVAAALAQTQRLLAEAGEPKIRERAVQIEAALQRLSHLSEKLMQLARAEGGRLQTSQSVDIARVLEMVMDELAHNKQSIARIVVSVPATSVMSNIDPDAFAILARNLIENALKHGAANEPVRVTLSQSGVLTVVNGGPPVPLDVLARLTQPFERGNTTASGSGLGLAIAKAIATGAGGDFILTSPLPGRSDGFEARFIVEASAPAAV